MDFSLFDSSIAKILVGLVVPAATFGCGWKLRAGSTRSGFPFLWFLCVVGLLGVVIVHARGLAGVVLLGLLCFAAGIDAASLEIPNAVPVAGLLVWLLVGRPFFGFGYGVLGTVVAFAFGCLLMAAARRICRTEGYGGGDVKLGALIGLWVGPRLFFFVMTAASLLALVYGLLLVARGRLGRRDPLPFGPWLALGTGCVLALSSGGVRFF